jgi:D-glycero-alpha-D-manno-heptose-7-phosphate kinase
MVNYSKTEIVKAVEEIQHPIVREALKIVGITKSIEIVSMADIPAGSGLGSSSSFTVGLLNALYAYTGQLKSAEELARTACHIEIDILKDPIGKQDQYIAAYGGFRYFQFNSDESTFTELIMYSKGKKDELAENLLIFHSGNNRNAGSILSEVKKNITHTKNVQCLKEMRDMAIELRNCLNNSCSPDTIAEFLHKGWLLKKQLATAVSNSRIDAYYEKATAAGALGGKMLGAGGEGFMLFYCPKEKQQNLLEELKDLVCVRFSLEPEGSKIIFIS